MLLFCLLIISPFSNISCIFHQLILLWLSTHDNPYTFFISTLSFPSQFLFLWVFWHTLIDDIQNLRIIYSLDIFVFFFLPIFSKLIFESIYNYSIAGFRGQVLNVSYIADNNQFPIVVGVKNMVIFISNPTFWSFLQPVIALLIFVFKCIFRTIQSFTELSHPVCNITCMFLLRTFHSWQY